MCGPVQNVGRHLLQRYLASEESGIMGRNIKIEGLGSSSHVPVGFQVELPLKKIILRIAKSGGV